MAKRKATRKRKVARLAGTSGGKTTIVACPKCKTKFHRTLQEIGSKETCAICLNLVDMRPVKK